MVTIGVAMLRAPGIKWTLLDAQENMTFAERFEEQVFRFENTKAFGVYRFNVTSISAPDSTLVCVYTPL